MPFADTTQMLHAAQAGGYDVGAFNAENMEMAQAIVLAAQEARAPVILQTTPSTLRYADPQLYWSNVQALAQRASVPVALHLDHGNSFELCAQALRAGYTSVMIDGSTLPLVQNIALTREVVRMCAANGVPVEGELGRVGGKEDDLECSETGYTDPDEAERFEVETGVSSLAVGVGTAHGVYAVPPVLNIELIDRIRQRLRIPLVLHGASGLEEKVIRECVRQGICKVNFATELRAAYTLAVRRMLAENPDIIDPKIYGRAGRDAVKERVLHRIRVCGCAGRA